MKVSKHTRKGLAEASAHYRETNDCGVQALAVFCDVDYTKAREALALQGRKPGKGVSILQLRHAARSLGYEMVDVKFLFKSKTLVTAGKRELPKLFTGKRLMFDVYRHVCGWNGEEILDWAAQRRKRIDAVYLAHKVRG